MIRLKNVSKFYNNNGIVASGISKVNLSFDVGEFVVITGESGSGKSTLLNVISGLDTYEEGELYINNSETSHYSEKDFEDYRRKYVSNIYQNFNLITSYTVYQNIELVLLLNGYDKAKIKEKINELIKIVNLEKFKKVKVSKLSGGQKQRVAIARALAKETDIIIADEPTGNIDSKQALEIIEILKSISKEKLVVVVTHNYEQFELCATRKIKMHDGKVLEDKKIIAHENYVAKEINYEDMNFKSKIFLMLRNTFNIIPKFMLLFLVFLFIVVAVATQYSNLEKQKTEANLLGYNNFFYNTDPNRIVVSKDNINYEELENLDNVDYIIKYDVLLDRALELLSNDIFTYMVADSVNKIDSVSYGRLPSASNEMVLEFNERIYSSDYVSRLLDQDIQVNSHLNNGSKFEVVGIRLIDDYNEKMYLTDEGFEELLPYSNLYNEIIINGKKIESYVFANDKVKENTVHVNKTACPNCLNDIITINNQELEVSNTVEDSNLVEGYDYSAVILINPNDYYEIFPYNQASIYVSDIKYINETNNELKELGYETLIVANTLVDQGANEIIIIFFTLSIIVLIVALFFISYFVIKIILKSRNVYFSTLRMLGASKKVLKQLLIGELIIVSSLAYISFTILVLSNIDVSILNNVDRYLYFNHYMLLYIVLLMMSYLIGTRYSSSLFKKSSITTINEEV